MTFFSNHICIRIVIRVLELASCFHIAKHNETDFPFSPFSTADYFPITIMLSSHFHLTQGFRPIWKTAHTRICCLSSKNNLLGYRQLLVFEYKCLLYWVLRPKTSLTNAHLSRDKLTKPAVRHCGTSISELNYIEKGSRNKSLLYIIITMSTTWLKAVW